MLREQLDSPQIVEEQHQRRDNYHQEQEEQHILDGSDGCGESYALRCAAPKNLEAVEVKETRHEGNVIAGERTPLLPPPPLIRPNIVLYPSSPLNTATATGEAITATGERKPRRIRNDNSRSSSSNTPQQWWFLRRIEINSTYVTIAILSISFAIERCSIKILSDYSGPFRASIVVIGSGIFNLSLHGISMALRALRGRIDASMGDDKWGWCFGWWRHRSRQHGDRRRGEMDMEMEMLINPLGAPVPFCFPPLFPLALTSCLDTLQLLLFAVGSSHVPPTLVVLIPHASVPLSHMIESILSRTTHSILGENDGDVDDIDVFADSGHSNKKRRHVLMSHGSIFIALSMIMGLAPFFHYLFRYSHDIHNAIVEEHALAHRRTALNALLVLASTIPTAASQVLKERTLMSLSGPVNPQLVNTVSSLFSILFALLLLPMVIPLQGIGGFVFVDGNTISGSMYPASDAASNLCDALRCLFLLSNNYSNYPEASTCGPALPLITLVHVSSAAVASFVIGRQHAASDVPVATTGDAIARAIPLSVVLAFVFMVSYRLLPPVNDDGGGWEPPLIAWHLVCATILVVGSNSYHRAAAEVPTYETSDPRVDDSNTYG